MDGRIYFWLILTAGISGCSREYPVGKVPVSPVDSHVDVNITVVAPEHPWPSGKALSEVDENTVSHVDVLVFSVSGSNETFSYRVTPTQISEDEGSVYGGRKRFTVSLRKSATPCKLVILTNLPQSERDRPLPEGGSKDSILSDFTLTAARWETDSGTFVPVPMWAEYGPVQVDEALSDSGISNLHLVRMLARLDVVVLPSARASFRLREVYLYNRNTCGLVAPASAAREAGRVSEPANPGREHGPLIYTAPADTGLVREIYTFESAAPASPANYRAATCIVVGGLYDGDTNSTYYRLDLKNSDGHFKDVLRNWCYRFEIESVSGRGYDNPDQAFNSASFNIDAVIKEWDYSEFPDVLFDRYYYLAVSKSRIELYADEYRTDKSDNMLIITTDYVTEEIDESGWRIDSITYGGASAGWLTLSKSFGGAGVEDSVFLYLTENDTRAVRSCSFVVIAGRFHYEVVVTQLVDRYAGIFIRDAADSEISELVFACDGTAPPVPQTFTVSWDPGAELLQVSESPLAPAFPEGCGQPPIGSIQGGVGRFTIAPPGLTAAEIAADPFIEKSSTLTFSLRRDGRIITRNLLLRQFHLHLQTAGSTTFSLDGGMKSFFIKANFPWKAELESNADVVADFPVQTGTYEIRNGLPVQFRATDKFRNPVPGFTSGDGRVKLSRFDGATYVDWGVIQLHGMAGIIMPQSNSFIVQPASTPIFIPCSIVGQSIMGRYITDVSKLRAQLVWADAGSISGTTNNVVRSVLTAGTGTATSLSDVYVFIIPGSVQGNAVALLYQDDDGNGNYHNGDGTKSELLWLFHIWNTDYNPYDAHGNAVGNTANPALNPAWMDRNMGARSNDAASIGLYYQWGRKDPLILYNGEANAMKNLPTDPYYNSATRASEYFIRQQNTSVDFYEAMHFPTNYYLRDLNGGTSWYDGAPTDLYPLWSTSKSVYDPCPPGWKLPAAADFGSHWLDASNFNADIGGYYPKSGFRDLYSWVDYHSQHVSCSVWTSTTNGNNFMAYRGNAALSPTLFHGNVLNVRCIRE
ncbi:MAG: hypothetical protein LBR06_07680 [Bacteroidales bacterium]|jgi:hypothetical protein|nr:hypothetical protein [Bacteroidales bacterium]